MSSARSELEKKIRGLAREYTTGVAMEKDASAELARVRAWLDDLVNTYGKLKGAVEHLTESTLPNHLAGYAHLLNGTTEPMPDQVVPTEHPTT